MSKSSETLFSDYRLLGSVTLPYPVGRQCYMHTFCFDEPTVPEGFEDYLPIVERLCESVGLSTGEAHMTIDEKVVKAGMSQRRPGPHVDGCFRPALRKWGHSGGVWLHDCNNIELAEVTRMPVIVAASTVGCRVWRGVFAGTPARDGDLSHIQDQLRNGEVLPANQGFLLSADCVHESIRMEVDTPRSFLRIALPNTFLAFETWS